MRSIRDFKSGIGKIAGKNLLDTENDIFQRGTKYNFLTGIVREVITNPYEYLNRPFKLNDNVYDQITFKDVLSGKVKILPDGTSIDSPIKNFYHVDNMPMNSVFVQIVDNSRSLSGEKMIVCYPFFPPHLSLPLKTGEYVWLVREDIKGLDNFYWMCRKVGIIQVDDLNFTNLERTSVITKMYDKVVESGRSFTPSPETFEKMISLGKSETSNIRDASYSDMLKTSYGYVNEFVGEAVPRVAKNSADLLLQGSNNAGIHLTTEKFKAVGEKPEIDTPAIDLFIKRKANSNSFKTNNQVSYSTTTAGSENSILIADNYPDSDTNLKHEEIDKVRDVLPNQDYETLYNAEIKDDSSDAVNVASRLYLSNESEFDENFGSNFDNLGTLAGTCIITYSENNRMIAEKNARIVNKEGQSYIDMTESGNIVIKASKDNGQEFLSLVPGQYTRINAKDKIYLTHGSDNNVPSLDPEPYVLVTQLEKILSNIYAILNAHNAAFFAIAPARHPAAIAPAIQALKTVLIDAKISTPTGKYIPSTPQPVSASPISGMTAVDATRILRSDHIIADKG